MNWLDIVLLVLIGASMISAFRKGFSREVVGFIAVIAAILLGCWFYGTVAGYLAPYFSSRGLANLLGFAIVFGGIMLLGAVIGRILRSVMKVAGLSIFDRVLGAGFGFVRAVLVAAAVMMAIMAFSPGKKPPDAVLQSRLAPYVMDTARVCSAMAPHEVREGFRSSYDGIRSLWKGALKQVPALPGTKREKDEGSI